MICGTLVPSPPGAGKRVSNAAVLMQNGEITFTQRKMLLPFYDVFDEQRYFAPAERQDVTKIGTSAVALTICEDAWNDKGYWKQRLYTNDPVEEQVRQGAHADPEYLVVAVLAGQARAARGDAGGSRRGIKAADPDGEPGGRERQPDLRWHQSAHECARRDDCAGALVCRRPGDGGHGGGHRARCHTDRARATTPATYAALVMGTRDYIRKCGFKQALIGLSGGIDSALVAAIAVDALGKENVIGVGMPSPYSSQGSIDDSRALANNLGIRFETIRIDGIFEPVHGCAGAGLRGTRAGRDGGESPVAHPRNAADGALEQAGRAGADDGQQVARWRWATARSTATWWARWR